jgi:hypothetical protein
MRESRGLTGNTRGGILIGAVIVLVVLAVFAATTGAIYASGLQAYAVSADSTCALYAADTGIELALKEYLAGADLDGDGTIVGISDDNNDANNPALGNGRILVHFVSGLMTATGTYGAAVRRIEVTLP